MEYEWDEAKRKANLRKHGVDFADVVWVERHGDTLRVISARKASPGEMRQYQE